LLKTDNKISLLPIICRYTPVARSNTIYVNNNVNNNKNGIFCRRSCLIKLLRQKKRYGAKKFMAEFPSKPWTLSELSRLLRKIDTDRPHFTFWGDLTNAAVTIVCVGRFD